jgi:hypothetical protein
LDKNEGFEAFAVKNHLHRYLFVQKHELHVDEQDNISILYYDQLRPWKVSFKYEI